MTQTAFVDGLMQRFEVTAISEFPAATDVDLGSRRDGEERRGFTVQGGSRVPPVVIPGDATGHR